MLDSVPSCEMHIILVLWMVLIAGTAYAFEIRDVNGVLHDTASRNIIVVIGGTNCPPLDNMIRFQLSGLIEDYPDVLALAIFPCTNMAPEAVRAWQRRVPGAMSFCPVEIDARAVHSVLTEWQSMGYPQYGAMLFSGDQCVKSWSYWQPRLTVEVPLTRELNSLTISRGTNGPVVSFRKTKIPWRLQTNGGPAMTTYQLVYP